MKTKENTIQLINTIRIVLLKKKVLQPNDSLLIAFSGGQDSIFILIVVYILKKQCKWDIKIFYCNHLWQKNSLYSYFHISKIACCLNVDLFFCLALKSLISEESARFWRSKTYFRLLFFSTYSTIVTGHTLNDQIETFFFNTIRGSNFSGSSSLKLKKIFNILNRKNFSITDYELTSFFCLKEKLLENDKKLILFYKKNYTKNEKKDLQQNKKIKIQFIVKKVFLIKKEHSNLLKITRPLIIKTRFDTKNICISWRLPLFFDETNEEKKYARNRLRKQIIPTFRFFFNPKIDLSLYNYLEIFIEEDYFKNKLIRKLVKKSINEDKNGYFFNLSFFCSLPLAFQRKICVSFFKDKLKRNYKFITIDLFVKFINKFFGLSKKRNKFIYKTNANYLVFFPEIGTVYFTKTLFLFIK